MNNSGFVYAMDAGKGLVKVGRTGNIARREKQLRMRVIYATEKLTDCVIIERRTHEILKKMGLHATSETFEASIDEVKSAIQEACTFPEFEDHRPHSDLNEIEAGILTIESYVNATGIVHSRLGSLACGNSHAVDRVLAGSGTIRSYYAIMHYIDRNPVDV